MKLSIIFDRDNLINLLARNKNNKIMPFCMINWYLLEYGFNETRASNLN